MDETPNVEFFAAGMTVAGHRGEPTEHTMECARFIKRNRKIGMVVESYPDGEWQEVRDRIAAWA